MSLARISPFWRVVIGLLGGVLAGLFVGEPMGRLQIAGDAYIRLLQMTVLPYVVASLVGGLGGLDAGMARRIGARGGGLILIVWVTTLLSMLCVPLAYPDWTTASFYSAKLEEEPPAFDALSLYLPANPFDALAHAIVPAVVVFSIALGLALITVRNKDELLSVLHTLSEALLRIASFVAKLAPIGIFAISAAAAGTLRLEELSRLQVYLWVYLAGWCVIAFWTLPALIGRSTPLRYADVLREARTPMITAFAAGTVLVVLPMIAERCKQLLVERDLDENEARTAIDVLVPTAYSFPSAGTLLGLGFVLWGAWYVGTPLTIGQYPSFATVGALTSFGSMAVSLPFLLDFFSLPADLFQLYLLGSVVTIRFAVAMAALHGVVVCLLASMALLGRLRVRALFEVAAISIGLTAVLMIGLGFVLTRAIPYEYRGDEDLVDLEPFVEPVAVRVVEHPSPLPVGDRKRDRFAVAVERGTLRIGYSPDRLPWVYRGSGGPVVGFDMDLVHTLARDIGLTLEVLRLEVDEAPAALDDGRIDIYVGATAITPERAQTWTFTRPYIDHTLSFVVPDELRQEFSDLSTIRRMPDLRIGIGDRSEFFRNRIGTLVPNAELVSLEGPRAFFRGQLEDLDALAFGGEAASAWTLIYPDYNVVVPKDVRFRVPAGFVLPSNQAEMVRLMDLWLMLADRSGLQDSIYRHWILGETTRNLEPRWSVIRDVLGWVE